MDQKDTRYARWLSGELSPDEIKAMKSSGEWEELEAIISATDTLMIPRMEMDKAYEKVMVKRHQSNLKVRKLPLVRMVSVAATILLLVVLFFIFNNGNKAISAQLANTVYFRISGSIQRCFERWVKHRV